MSSTMIALKLEEKIKEFISSNKKNCCLQFLMKYLDMVTRLAWENGHYTQIH